MSQIIKPVMLDETGQVSVQRLTELNALMLQLAEAVAAVHSVNGMIDDVILDSTNITVNKLDPSSPTIAQLLASEQGDIDTLMATLQAAIGRTPLTFSTSQIEGDDYELTFTVGTP